MASSTTRPTFSFLHHHHLSSKPSKSSLLPFPKLPAPSFSLLIKPHSVDLSKDDKPLQEQEPQPETEGEETEKGVSSVPKFDARRLEEKFAVLNTGISECRSCGYLYNESAGDPSYPIPPGLTFKELPEDWRCPTCGAAKTFFQSKSVEIAGFVENQQFGLGGNTLTSGQKALLIYGSLLLAFCLFLSGYFLQ